ncbi:aryl-alcohol dehydrogenase [Sporobacter termitidis DSM 10068]|uniref:Aryl-alcohol dehydrogenase n=1 Tax=Sporobacter termitidis DSM 10068 TaxID=1123282 RepID=A0A1M5YWR9_9FIRM|nr:NAD(P)-dependent alcohol dehydrogenase [Sporobacter termitidis]SHI16290.1 aryl-alcohol dehydrogenase [Sporobacter termitidis DSM 10068]
MKVQAAVTREKGKFEIETVELAEPKAGEVLVKLVASGICHTDTAVIEQYLPVVFPMVAGHEGVGVIEKVGPGVSALKPGDRVILTFPSCGVCEHCQEGHPYSCDDNFNMFFGGNYRDGTKRMTDAHGTEIGVLFGQSSFATYAVANQDNAIKVDVDTDELKALCSLGCGVQTGAGAVLNRMKPRPGSSIAVFGCGAVGLAGIMAAKIAGCSTIIAIHGSKGREEALAFGATHTINGRKEDTVARIKEITGGKGVNYALESSGQPPLAVSMLDSMAKEGLAVTVSVTANAEVPIKLEPQIMNPSVTFAGCVEGHSNPKVFIPELVKFYKEGKLPVDKMCKYYKFEEIEKAFEDSHTGGVLKPVIVF